MKHPNALLLEKIYVDFSNGQFDKVLSACASNVTFQVAGKSKLAGKYTKADFVSGFAAKIKELSGGSSMLEVHDILASDRHGVVLASHSLDRKGEKAQFRTVHVWRFESGQPVAFYEYPRDMYQYDGIWN